MKNPSQPQRHSLPDAAAILAILLLLILAVDAVTHTASAAGVTRGTLLLGSGDGKPGLAAITLHTEVEMDITAMLARVKVRQHFRNPGQDWAEGVYLFPLPETAAVDHLRMRVGERIIEGEIREKKQARKEYRQAKEQGLRASLVEQERPNVFTASVANIAPGGEIVVELEYQQDVAYRDGRFSLRFPLVVAPRYIPGPAIHERISISDGWSGNGGGVTDASRITPPVRKPGQRPTNRLSILVRLTPGIPLESVTSRYHPMRVERDGARYLLSLAEGEIPADRDLELVWTPTPGSAPRAALFTERHGGQTHALLMLMPPADGYLQEPHPPRDVTFIIDTSGSMHGESMQQARQALILALQRLNDRDRFNIIQFNHQTRPLYEHPRPADMKNRRHASRWVASLEADGGTEMAPALRLALRGDHTGRLHQVVFLTDGAVGNEDDLFRLIRHRLGDSRLFIIGIGSAPNSHFMRRAARIGRGGFIHIGDTGEVLEGMNRLLQRLEHPALTDIRLELPDSGDQPSILAYPDPIPDLYLGEPVTVTLRMPALPPVLVLKGRFGARPWQSEIRLDGAREGNGVATLWARRRIANLMEHYILSHEDGERARLRQAVTDTALRHHLVSRFTSLVAVDKTPARLKEELLRRQRLQTNLPHGWDYGKVFGMARTATPAGLQLALGLSLLLIASLAAWRLRGRGRPA